jgi:hypothetical protein
MPRCKKELTGLNKLELRPTTVWHNSYDMQKGWFVLAVTSAVVVFFVVGAYALHFGPQSGWHLSPDQEDWARFGEYVGGIFGMLAFVGVLVTVNLQRAQLDEQRKQFGLQEIQRMAADSSKTVDMILAREPSGVTDTLRQKMRVKGASMSVFNMLSAIGVNAMKPPSTDYMVKAKRNELQGAVLPIISADVGLALIELQHLVQCLEAYVRGGGSSTVIELYKSRYTIVVAWIDLVGLMSADIVERYFDPKGYLEARAAKAKTSSGDQSPAA